MNDLLPEYEQIEKELLAREMGKTLIINDLFQKVEVPRQVILELLRLPLTAHLRVTLMEALNRRHLSGNATANEIKRGCN